MLFLRLLQRPFASVVILLYLVGIFGFDVHWSSDSHQAYIIPLFTGIECDNIHPDSPCHNHDYEDEECEDNEDCCHDSVNVLSLSGCSKAHFLSIPLIFTLILDEKSGDGLCFTATDCIFHRSHSISSPPKPNLSMLCTLRV